jgi:hypothetical protein
MSGGKEKCEKFVLRRGWLASPKPGAFGAAAAAVLPSIWLLDRAAHHFDVSEEPCLSIKRFSSSRHLSHPKIQEVFQLNYHSFPFIGKFSS